MLILFKRCGGNRSVTIWPIPMATVQLTISQPSGGNRSHQARSASLPWIWSMFCDWSCLRKIVSMIFSGSLIGRSSLPLNVQHQPPALGAGDADHHGLVSGTLGRRQDTVAVVGFAGNDAGLAGAADALFARARHVDAGFAQHRHDGFFRRYGQR